MVGKYKQKGKMAERGYNKIRVNYTFLLGELESTIISPLFQEHVFDQDDVEKVKSKDGTREQINELLTILMNRCGHDSYDKFIDVLNKNGYRHAVAVLESEYKDESDESGFVESDAKWAKKKGPLAKIKEALCHKGTPGDDEFKELRVVIVGKTGSGKSSLGNSLLKKKDFVCKSSPSSVTKECSDFLERRFDKLKIKLRVLDTPGFFDTGSDVNVGTEIARCILKTAPGPHIFIYVMSINSRFSKEEKDSIDLFKNTFGEHALDHLVVVFTGADQLEGQTLEEWLKEAPVKLHEFLDECKNRYAAINNKAGKDELKQQVIKITELLAKTHKDNEGDNYTNGMYKEAEAIFRQKQEEAKRDSEKKERALQEMCDKLIEQLEVQNGVLANLRGELANLRGELANLRDELAKKEKQIAELQRKQDGSKAKDEKIAQLEQEQKQKIQDMEILANKINELQEAQHNQSNMIKTCYAKPKDSKATEIRGESIKCKLCKYTVAHGSNLLNIPGDDPIEKSAVTVFGKGGVLKQRFKNPGGYLFDLYTTLKADTKITGDRTLEYTWFNGFDWAIMRCKGEDCNNHIGWKYQKDGETPFYGLIDANLTE